MTPSRLSEIRALLSDPTAWRATEWAAALRDLLTHLSSVQPPDRVRAAERAVVEAACADADAARGEGGDENEATERMFDAVSRLADALLAAARERDRLQDERRLLVRSLADEQDRCAKVLIEAALAIRERDRLRETLLKRQAEYPHADYCAGFPRNNYAQCDCDARLTQALSSSKAGGT